MKLICKFGLAALLVALLAVPALARHQGGTSTHAVDVYQKIDGSIKGESIDKGHKTGVEKGGQDLPYNVKGESTYQPSERKAGRDR